MNQDTYNSTVGLETVRPPYVQADVSVGRALQGLGAATGNTAEQLEEYQQKESQLWVITSMAEREKKFSAKLASATYQDGGVQPGFYKQLNEEMDADYKELLNNAPSEHAKHLVTARYVGMATQFGEHAMRMEAATNRGNILGMAQAAVSDSAQASIVDGDFNRSAETVAVIAKNLKGMVPPGQIAAFEESAQRTLDKAQTDATLQAQGPGATADAMEAGQIGQTMPQEYRAATIASLRRNQNIAHVAGQSQADVATNVTLAKIENGVSDDDANVSSVRQAYITAHSTALNGAARTRQATEAAAAFDQQLGKARFSYSVKQDFLSLPVGQHEQMLQKVADEFGAGSPQWQVVAKISNELSRQAKNDPVGYVLNDPLLSKEYNESMVSGEPQKIQSAFAKVVAAQEQAGIKPRVFTPSQATQLSQNITAMLRGTAVTQADGSQKQYGAVDAVQAIQSIDKQYGPFSHKVFEELATAPVKEARLPMEAQYIAGLPSNDPRALIIAQAMRTPRQDVDAKAQGVGNKWSKDKESKISDALQTNDTWRQFSQTNAVNAPESVKLHEEMIHRQADFLMFSGQAKSEADAVEKAIGNTVGAVFQFKGGLQIPTYDDNGKMRGSSDVSTITNNLDFLQQYLIKNQKIDVAINTGNIKDEGFLQSLFRNARNNTGWQTVADGKGAQLMNGTYFNGRFMPTGPAMMDGKPVIVDYSKAETFPASGGVLSDVPLLDASHDPKVLKAMTGERDRVFQSLFRPATEPQQAVNSNKAAPAAPAKVDDSLSNHLPEPLKKLSGTFHEQANRYGLDPALLAAISMHETGQGTSKAFRDGNNAMGVSNESGPVAFTEPGASISKMAKQIATSPLYAKYRQSGDLADLASVYAPVGAKNDPRGLNKDWHTGVSKFYKQLKGDS